MKIGVYFEGNPKMGGGFFQSLQSCLILADIQEYQKYLDFIITNEETKKYLNTKFLQVSKYKQNKILNYYSKLFEINIFKEIFNKLGLNHPFTNFIKRQKYDLIIFLGPSMLSRFCDNTAFVSNIWDLDHKKNSQFPEHNLNYKYEDKEKLINDIVFRAFRIIVPHKSNKNDLINIYKAEENKINVQNFIPYLPTVYDKSLDKETLYDEIFKKFNLPSNKKIIFYPAQFWAHKNHKYIIDTVEILKKNNDEKFHFVFCGDTKNNFKYIDNLISIKQLKNYFTIFNFLTDDQVLALYKNCNAVVMPTYCGPTNLPIYESFYFKKIIFYTKGLIANDEINNGLIEIDISSPKDFYQKLDICFEENKIKKITEKNYEYYRLICDKNLFKKTYKKILDDFSYLLNRWK
tara:strand:+ start:477 stop:1688 length:1212 start_codon:yes stop_codon:yes gene_type:complete